MAALGEWCKQEGDEREDAVERGERGGEWIVVREQDCGEAEDIEREKNHEGCRATHGYRRYSGRLQKVSAFLPDD